MKIKRYLDIAGEIYITQEEHAGLAGGFESCPNPRLLDYHFFTVKEDAECFKLQDFRTFPKLEKYYWVIK